jgi:DNA-binding NarL/FixJ family response regulator
MIRTLIADDNMVMRLGLRWLLETSDRVTVVGEASDGLEAIESSERLQPDVVVLDVRMPRMDGIAALDRLVGRAGVLMLSHGDDRDVIARAVRAGATGYLVHGQFAADDLIAAVVSTASRQAVLSPVAVAAVVDSLRAAATQPALRSGPPPGHGLSRREVEIMEHIVRGRSNSEIAHALFLSEKTVKNHVNHVYTKLRCANRAEAIAYWLGLASRQGSAVVPR